MGDRSPDIFDTEEEGGRNEEYVEEEEEEEEELDPEEEQEEEEEKSSSSEEEEELGDDEPDYDCGQGKEKTLQCFIDEDNMDFDEAAESAVEKRKFLLNRVIGRKILPEKSDDEEEKEEASV